MSSLTYTQPASMLKSDEYADHIPRLEHEANWAHNTSLEVLRSSERAEVEQVKVARKALQLHATQGWRLRDLDDLVRDRAFINRRPGGRPDKANRAALEVMTPAEFMRSLFTEGLAFTACPDDLVYAALLAFAETHYTASDQRAARTLNEATLRILAVRAGIEPITEELLNG